MQNVEYDTIDKENKRLIAEENAVRTRLRYKFMRGQIVDADLEALQKDNEELRQNIAVYKQCKDWKEANAKMEIVRQQRRKEG